MAILICGTTALDNIIINKKEYKNKLGGSAFHAAIAASVFSNVYLSGRVGKDFPFEEVDELFKRRNIDYSSIEIDENNGTFRWTGEYLENFDDRITKFLDLGSWVNYQATVPHKEFNIVVLANMSPVYQKQIINKTKANLYLLDTMNHYILNEREALEEVLKLIDIFVLNDEEYRLLTQTKSPYKAARKILENYTNLKYLIIKKGSNGAILFSKDKIFIVPAYPLEEVVDPTGAGDSFLGGLAGYLDINFDLSFDNMKQAVLYATSTASFNVEGVSIDKIKDISFDDIEQRVEYLKKITQL